MIDRPLIAKQLRVNNVMDAPQQHCDGKRCNGMGQDQAAEAKAKLNGSSYLVCCAQRFCVEILQVHISF
jgi:hypothetical protein